MEYVEGKIPFRASIQFVLLPEYINLDKAEDIRDYSKEVLEEELLKRYELTDELELEGTEGNEVFYTGSIYTSGCKLTTIDGHYGAHLVDYDWSTDSVYLSKDSNECLKQKGFSAEILSYESPEEVR